MHYPSELDCSCLGCITYTQDLPVDMERHKEEKGKIEKSISRGGAGAGRGGGRRIVI